MPVHEDMFSCLFRTKKYVQCLVSHETNLQCHAQNIFQLNHMCQNIPQGIGHHQLAMSHLKIIISGNALGSEILPRCSDVWFGELSVNRIGRDIIVLKLCTVDAPKAQTSAALYVFRQCCKQARISTFPRSKNAYELLNLKAFLVCEYTKCTLFQCMGKIFWVEFQRVHLKFHTMYLTHTLKDDIIVQCSNFKSS